MRKHIFGFALFVLIISSAIFAYRLVYPSMRFNVPPPRDETSSMPVLKPARSAKDIYTINATSVVVDVKSGKVYAGIEESATVPSPDEFVKVVMLTEGSDEVMFQTRWLNYTRSTNLVFACDECASMTAQKNYYARVYLASAPDDANLRLRLENEKNGGFYFKATSVQVSSGKK
jgi:hypothetical protein